MDMKSSAKRGNGVASVYLGGNHPDGVLQLEDFHIRPGAAAFAVGYADIVDLAGLEGGHSYRNGYGRSVVFADGGGTDGGAVGDDHVTAVHPELESGWKRGK